ncbi:hypothetical protein RJI07_03600 [Mycoplasmatota bacterium WC30]
MEIKLESNRKFMLYYTISFAVVFTALLFVMFIGQAIGSWTIIEKPGDLGFVITIIVIDIILIIATLLIIFYKGKCYIFKEDAIEIYKHNKLIESIKMTTIERMEYYPFRLHYLITIFLGALPDGGAWKFHLFNYEGNKYLLGFIGEKDAYRIKELYPNKVNIMYERKKKNSYLLHEMSEN